MLDVSASTAVSFEVVENTPVPEEREILCPHCGRSTGMIDHGPAVYIGNICFIQTIKAKCRSCSHNVRWVPVGV